MNLEKTFDQILRDAKTLKVQQTVADWKEAIKLAVDLLVKAKIATAAYADKIITATAEFGPYYLVADYVAMPHAAPSEANLNNGFSMVTLKKAVMFGDQPIKVVICLSSTTPDFHVATALPQIAAMFDDLQMGTKLAEATSEQAVYDLISKVDFRRYL